MDITFLLIHFFSFILQLFSSKRGIRLPKEIKFRPTGKPVIAEVMAGKLIGCHTGFGESVQ